MNGTVINTQPTKKSKKWYVNFVLWCIKKASKSPYTHSQLWVNGTIYETGHPEGFQKHERPIPQPSAGKTILEPIRELTEKECEAIVNFFENKIRNGIKYNYA